MNVILYYYLFNHLNLNYYQVKNQKFIIKLIFFNLLTSVILIHRLNLKYERAK